jgi:hypothetical protein
VTNVQLEDVTVTVKMRTGVGPYRLNQLVDAEPDTAAGWMSAGLADLMPVAAPAAGEVLAELDDTGKGATDGAAQRVEGTGKPRRRSAARNAVVDGVHDGDDAAGTKPVEGTNPS